MPESTVGVTPGAGANLHSWQRSISGLTNPLDEFVIPGEYPYPSFEAHSPSSSAAVANDHQLAINAGASTYLRIRRIRVEQAGAATTAASCTMGVFRLSTLGSGGTAVTPRPFDTADTAASTGLALPGVKGTETVELFRFTITLRQVVSGTGSPADDGMWEWTQHPGTKPIIVPAGTANGIAVKNFSAIAGATLICSIEYVETTFTG